MIAQLTKNERQLALIILVAVAALGLAVAAIARHDPLGPQGAVVLVVAVAAIFGVISGFAEPEPGEDRFDRYYDEPSKAAEESADEPN